MILTIILAAVAAAAAVTLIISYIAYRMAFYHDRQPVPLDKKSRWMDDEEYAKSMEWINLMAGREYEKVTITSFDGLQLSARYYHVKEGAPVQIQCHGYKGSSLRDFCGGNKLAHEKGHNTLVIDQRTAGESQGNVISFGINERKDLRKWIDFVIERNGSDVEIMLTGVSMGAATVLMTAGMELPPNVKCVAADCPYSSPEKIIKKVAADKKLPPQLMTPFIRLGARLFGGFNINEDTPEEAVKRTKIPVLLIHGDRDSFVPYEMAVEIYEANRDMIQFETFPGADHGTSMIKDEERYKKLTEEFIDKYMG